MEGLGGKKRCKIPNVKEGMVSALFVLFLLYNYNHCDIDIILGTFGFYVTILFLECLYLYHVRKDICYAINL